MKMAFKQINPTGNKRGLVFIFGGCASGLFKSMGRGYKNVPALNNRKTMGSGKCEYRKGEPAPSHGAQRHVL